MKDLETTLLEILTKDVSLSNSYFLIFPVLMSFVTICFLSGEEFLYSPRSFQSLSMLFPRLDLNPQVVSVVSVAFPEASFFL